MTGSAGAIVAQPSWSFPSHSTASGLTKLPSHSNSTHQPSKYFAGALQVKCWCCCSSIGLPFYTISSTDRQPQSNPGCVNNSNNVTTMLNHIHAPMYTKKTHMIIITDVTLSPFFFLLHDGFVPNTHRTQGPASCGARACTG